MMWNVSSMWLFCAVCMITVHLGYFVTGLLRESEAVGFTAYVQEEQLYVSRDLITLSGEVVNEGGHYNVTQSRFYCPYSGVYYLSMNLMRYETYVMDLAIAVGNSEDSVDRLILTIYDSDDGNEYNVGTNNRIFDCAVGEFVWVRGSKIISWERGSGNEYIDINCLWVKGYRNPDYGNAGIYGEPGIPYSTLTIFMMSKHQDVDRSEVSLHKSFVGFTACGSFTSIEYSSGTVIPLTWDLKPSPDYDSDTGVYTCPVSGVYYVTMNMQKYGEEGLHLSVSQDGQAVLHIDDVYESGNDRIPVSNSRVLACEENQTLAIMSTAHGWVNSGFHTYSTFSVMLMYKPDDLFHTFFAGFTAVKTSDQNYRPGETITFDTVLLDVGGDFNLVQNSFICPVSGLYFVAVTFKKVGTTPLMLEVITETGGVILNSKDISIQNPNNTISNSGLCLCSPGELVRVVSYGDGAVHGHPDNIITTFSVMLIQQYQ